MSTDSDFFLKKTIRRQIKPLACEKFIITATKPKIDKDGTPIMKQVNSKPGKPLFDMNGDPIMTQVMVAINLCRKNKESEQIPWTLEDLLQDHNLNKIKSLNVRDHAIYITPQEQGTGNIHILIDDTSNVIFEIFGKPNNFLQTSPKSQQAIYTVPYTHQRDLYNEIFKYMNLKYGDPNLSGLRHPFRLAGFSNRKQKYMDNEGKFPFVKTISTCKEMSPQLTDFIEKCASGEFPIIDEVKRLKDKYKAVDQYEEDADDIPASVTKAPAQDVTPPSQRSGLGTTDHRGEDFSATLKAAWQGVEGEDLESFVAENSMHLIDMCGYDTNAQAYIEKTAANAAQAVAEAKANFTPRPIQKDTGNRHDGAKNFLLKKQAFMLKRREAAQHQTPPTP